MYRQPLKRQAVVSPFVKRVPVKGALESVPELFELVRQLQAMRAEHENLVYQLEAEHKQKLDSFQAEHRTKLAAFETLRKTIEQKLEQISIIQKGDPGTPAPAVDEKALEDRVFARIPVPKDGKSVDKEEVVKDVLKSIVIPKVKDGDPGKDAIIDDKAIEKIVKTIREGKKIHVTHLAGWQDPEVLLARFHARGGIRGGGDTVAAGTNITITKNANGVSTIASTGGAGFSTLTATETPNGVLAVFTFAGASAKPSCLVVDNVWMKATTASGTVNWTWNDGLKQATLTIPSVDDIWGVV